MRESEGGGVYIYVRVCVYVNVCLRVCAFLRVRVRVCV